MRFPLATLCVSLVTLHTSLFSQPNGCSKTRLAETVNRFQPTTMPVLSWDGATLYLDRKLHPENVEGANDPDDVWVSRKGSNGQWTEARQEKISTFRAPDVIFSMSSDGRRALMHGPFIVRGRDTTRCFGIATRAHRDSLFTTITPVVLPNTPRVARNFYGHMNDAGTLIVMAIERGDAYGDLDLYVSRRCGTVWSEPMNLGPTVNTTGFEGAPHLAPDGVTLYYASNGLDDRRGKTDLYVTRRLDDTWTNWSTPTNLGPCINSSEEEKAFCLLPNGREALIVSWDADAERQGIYRVELPESARPRPYCVFTGVVQDNHTKERIAPSAIAVRDTSHTDTCMTLHLSTSLDGSFSIVLPQQHHYAVSATAPQYVRSHQVLGIRTLDSISPLHLTISLFDTRRPLASLYFERGSFRVSDSSVAALRALATTYGMRAVNFDVAGYADMLGSVPFNKVLSEQRAESVAATLATFGIDPVRVTARGKGIEAVGMTVSGSRENPLSRRVDIFPAESSIMRK